MFTKQIKIVRNGKIEKLLFTRDDKEITRGTSPLYLLDIETAANMVAGNTKLPPYNYFDKKLGDITCKSNAIKKMMGVSSNKTIKNVNQYAGVVEAFEFDLDIPIVSVVYLYDMNNINMLYAKFIADLDTRRSMYSMLKRITAMFNDDNNITEVGILKGRAATKDSAYEMICDFAISIDTLKLLEEEGYGFVVNTQALQNFNYKLANLTKSQVPKQVTADFIQWSAEHNNRVYANIKRAKS